MLQKQIFISTLISPILTSMHLKFIIRKRLTLENFFTELGGTHAVAREVVFRPSEETPQKISGSAYGSVDVHVNQAYKSSQNTSSFFGGSYVSTPSTARHSSQPHPRGTGVAL